MAADLSLPRFQVEPAGDLARHKALGLRWHADDEKNWRPQGDSNPRYRRERAMSWASRRWGLKGGNTPIYRSSTLAVNSNRQTGREVPGKAGLPGLLSLR